MSRFEINGRVPCGKNLNGFKTRVLDPSMLLFRGERKKIHALLNSPMFFSTHEVAMLYRKLGCDAVRATQPLCLFEFSLHNVRRLSLQLNNNDLAVLKLFFGVGMRSSDYKNTRGVRCKVPRNKSRSQPMICTEGFLSQSEWPTFCARRASTGGTCRPTRSAPAACCFTKKYWFATQRPICAWSENATSTQKIASCARNLKVLLGTLEPKRKWSNTSRLNNRIRGGWPAFF